MVQLMPLPPSVSYFSKIQLGITFLVPAHLQSQTKGHYMGVVVFLLNRSADKISKKQ